MGKKSSPETKLENDEGAWERIYFHFHPSIANYFRSVSGKFSVWKLTIIWDNEALQIMIDRQENKLDDDAENRK